MLSQLQVDSHGVSFAGHDVIALSVHCEYLRAMQIVADTDVQLDATLFVSRKAQMTRTSACQQSCPLSPSANPRDP
jgi:hypothetical protein